MNTHTADTIFNGGMKFTATIGGHEVVMDAGHDDGGQDSAPSPKKLMLASLAGCTGIDIVMILNKMKVEFSEFSIHTEAEQTDDHPKTYKKVKLIYRIKVAEHDKIKMEKAVMLSQDKYCGVSAMFREFADLTWSVHYLD